MPTPTQESIYNGALTIIRERKLASTSEATPSRYVLDTEYHKSLAWMLEQGAWMFASRTASIPSSGSPSFGWTGRFEKPSDLVRLIAISASEDLFPGLGSYDETGAAWQANASTIYIQYVSDDATDGGGNRSIWPETYTRAVEFDLAVRIAGQISNVDEEKLKLLEERAKTALDASLAKDQVKSIGRSPAAGTIGAVYAGALTAIGQRYQRSPDAARSTFQALDVEYPKALAATLQQADWEFAQRLATVTPSGSPTGGYTNAFPKPADFARLIAISDKPARWPTLGAYDDNATTWQADCSTLYVAYVSDGASYGADVSKWPAAFADAVEASLAARVANLLILSGADGSGLDAQTVEFLATKSDKLAERAARALGTAIEHDAIDGTVGRPPALGTYLAVYAGATALVKQRYPKLLGESKEIRQTLDLEYPKSLQYMLEQGLWNFAEQTVAIDPEIDAEPAFGYTNAFEKPGDFVRLVAISADDRFSRTLDEYRDAGAYWYADCDPIYVSYVSNDSALGGAISRWPATFLKAVEHDLACRLAASLPEMSAVDRDILARNAKNSISDARSKDAMNQPVMRAPPGRLRAARAGMSSYHRGWRTR